MKLSGTVASGRAGVGEINGIGEFWGAIVGVEIFSVGRGVIVTGDGGKVGMRTGVNVASGGRSVGRGDADGITTRVGRLSGGTEVSWQAERIKVMIAIRIITPQTRGMDIMIRLRLIGLFLILCVCAACSQNDGQVAELPTRVNLPTLTETLTATTTLTPTVTNTPTLTSTASNTPTRTPTNTPTLTFTPANTATPTLTATATFTLTPTLTLTPEATLTPLPPQIITFTASATSVTAGTQITLSWQTDADTVVLQRLNAQSAVVETTSVIPNGQIPVTIPSDGTLLYYRLVAQRGGQEAAQSIPINVTIPCSIAWFFGNQFVTNGACPLAVEVSGVGSYQPFQNGIMVLVTANGQNRVYGLNLTNGQYAVYNNLWDGTSTYTCPCGAPPTGYFAAQGVFGWAYNNTNGTTGAWYGPQGIGWATAGIDNAQTHVIQFEQNGTAFYLRIPGYGIVRMSGAQTGTIGTWTRVNGAF